MSRFILSLFLLVTLGLSHAAEAIQVRLDEKGRVHIQNSPAKVEWNIVVGEGTEAEIASRPAISGEWSAERTLFTPRFPLKPGTQYRLVDGQQSIPFATPAPKPQEPAIVRQIYPTAEKLPENILRFYVEFSKPMSRGDIYRHIKIVDSKGKAVDQPFLELDEELWNRDQTRVTLLIDPGRIKREVKPRMDLGPVFIAGETYTFIIDKAWKDADDVSLAKEHRKNIIVQPAVAHAPTRKNWKVINPTSESKPIQIAFGRPMDYALLSRSIDLLDSKGNLVPGTATIKENESVWEFTPSQPWDKSATYRLSIDTVLEDVSGNAVDRAFEVDVFKKVTEKLEVKKVEIPFRVGTP